MSHLTDGDQDDLIEFIDDPVAPAPGSGLEPWRILIVDDASDVHEATLLALRDLGIEGRSLFFLQAYSASEARAILASDPSVAVILLDVVMESEDAGLQLVRWIRDELHNHSVRIILRTGQPGYAPEIETIRSYDINDYRTKSELTRVRLFTSLTVAIRSYAQIRQIEMSRRGLELIVEASTDLIRLRALQHFAEGVVIQVCALLNIAPEGLICASSPGPISGEAPLVIAAAGRYRNSIHRPLEELPEAPVREALRRCLLEKRHIFGQSVCLYFNVNDSEGMAAFLAVTHEPSQMDRDLLEVFCANISVGFENVLLHDRLYQLAYFDPLTGLANRNHLIQLIEEKAREPDMTLALLDLDDFASIALALDHRFGDQVLQALAVRLTQSFGPQVNVARVAGDAFGLLGSRAVLTPERIEQTLAEPLRVEGETIRISATASLIELNGTAGQWSRTAQGCQHGAQAEQTPAARQGKLFFKKAPGDRTRTHAALDQAARRLLRRTTHAGLSTPDRPGQRTGDRRRGAAALGDRAGALGGARPLYPAGRTVRSHRAARGLGAAHRLSGAQAAERTGPQRLSHGDQYLTGAVSRTRLCLHD